MNLPMQPLIERGLAHLASLGPQGVLQTNSPCKGQGVMVALVWARGESLIRYPSPAGRGGCPQGRRPCFFLATLGRQNGQDNSTTRRIVPNCGGMTAAQMAAKKTIRGKETCKASPNGRQRSVLPRCFRAAATPLQNRQSLAEVQALQLRTSQRATCSQARLSARLRMSHIARSSRHAAKALTPFSSLVAMAATSQTKATSEHACSGVAFSLPNLGGVMPAITDTKGTCHV